MELPCACEVLRSISGLCTLSVMNTSTHYIVTRKGKAQPSDIARYAQERGRPSWLRATGPAVDDSEDGALDLLSRDRCRIFFFYSSKEIFKNV